MRPSKRLKIIMPTARSCDTTMNNEALCDTKLSDIKQTVAIPPRLQKRDGMRNVNKALIA